MEVDTRESCYETLVKNNSIDKLSEYYAINNNEIWLNDIFMYGCKHGIMDVIKWIHNIPNNNIVPCWGDFGNMCANGYFELAKFVYKSFDNTNIRDNIHYPFRNTCYKGHLEIAQWLFSISNIPIDFIDDIFIYTCAEGQLHIIQWLLPLTNNIKITNIIFNRVCRNGHLNVAKWLYENKLYEKLKVEAFNNACQSGQLELVQWFTTVSTKTKVLNDTFYSICENGHYDVVKFLIEREDNAKLTALDFKHCVIGGNIKLVELIISKKPEIYDIVSDCTKFTNYNNLFCLACEHNRFEMCQWLLTKFPNINISFEHEKPFINACINNNIDMAKWLYEKKPDINILVDQWDENENILYKICEKKKLQTYKDLANWLISIEHTNELFMSAFCTVCRYLSVDEIKFMISLDYNIIVDEYSRAFQTACLHDCSLNAKYLFYIQPNLDISINNNISFIKSIKKYYLEVSQLLHSINPNIINEVNLAELFYSCLKKDKYINYSSIDHLQWIYSLDKTIIDKVDINDLINHHCIQMNLDIVEWLYSLRTDIIIEVKTFQICCMNNSFTTVMWIYSIQPNIDFWADSDFAFRTVCENEYIQLAQWFCSINPNYTICYNESEHIINYTIHRSLVVDTSIIIDTESSICPICYEREVEYQLNCSHNYCISCITTHYSHKTTCPMCRAEIIKCYPIKNSE